MSDSSDFFSEIRERVRPFLSDEQYKRLEDVLLQVQWEWRGVQIYICIDQHYRNSRRKRMREEYDQFIMSMSRRYGIGVTRIRQELKGSPYLSRKDEKLGSEQGQDRDLWCE